MRLVSLKLNYNQYRAILDKLLETAPYGFLNAEFSAKLGKGFFFFWDESYIPETMKIGIKRPPGAAIDKLNEEIKKIMLED